MNTLALTLTLTLAAALLRLRLALVRAGPLLCGALVLCVLGAALVLWLAPQRAIQARRQSVALEAAALPARTGRAPVSANDNLIAFYAALGEQRHAEQQVRTLFALAGKAGLTLRQGQYKSSYDSSAALHTYQITLPVRGSYEDIWQFGLMALQAIPFASLDDISFRRESIGEPEVDARLRLTLYLAKPGAAR